MKTLIKIAVIAVSVASLSSCDWISGTHSDSPDSTSVIVPIDTTKGIVVIDSAKEKSKPDTTSATENQATK